MTLYKGVNVIEGQGVSPIEGLSQTVTGLMGTFERGELNKATIVTTLADFQRKFGSKALTGITSYFDVKSFFAKAGEAALALVNVKGSAAAKADKTFQDINGTPADTLKVEAASEGAHGNNLTVEILDDSILTTSLQAQVDAADESATLVSTTGLVIGSFVQFDNGTNQEKVVLTSVNSQTGLVQWSGGLTYTHTIALTVVTSIEFEVVVYENAIQVEDHPGLSMNDDVSFYCESVINSSSNYIRVTDLDSASTPAYRAMPDATTAPTALDDTAGDDDLDGLELEDWQGSAALGTGIYAFGGVANLFRIGCPNPKINTDADESYATLVQDLLNYARLRQDIEVYAEVPYGKTQAEAVTFAAGFEGRELGIFYPWVSAIEAGGKIWVSPVAGVLGAAAEKDARRGIYKNVGNERLAYGTDIERYSTRTEEETLNNAGVNTIILDQGLKIWGGRTQSAVTVWRFINHSELFNYISATLKGEVGDVAFEPINAVTMQNLSRRIEAFFNRLVVDGGVIAFVVQCDSTNNPPAQTALGYLNCAIEYQPAGVAEKIIFTITSSPAGITSTLLS